MRFGLHPPRTVSDGGFRSQRQAPRGGEHGGRREVRLGTMAAVMVPGFEALAALLSVLSRGADGGRVFRILSGKYPEYLAENAVPCRGERAL